MAVTIILCVLIGVWLVINIAKMVKNVKAGNSIDGCNGNCSHCTSGSCGGHHYSRKERKEARKRLEEAKKAVEAKRKEEEK